LLIYGNVTRRARGARAAHAIISDLSKIEGRLMAHFEATMMLTTDNHFKTLLKAICGFTGPKTPKIRPKKGPKSARKPKFGNKMGTQGRRDPVLVPNESSP